ncbi:hypothetical protein QBC44DRAFT_367558 [Cladorrhinum sp. PSN332]|nr:hypothetical protein QBC44DRAFT_367558 [Cladorrhinum sp. PSN332]
MASLTVVSLPGRKRCRFENVPTEIKFTILSYIDVPSLKSLIFASPEYSACYHSRRLDILGGAIARSLGPVVNDVLAIEGLKDLGFFTPDSTSECSIFRPPLSLTETVE